MFLHDLERLADLTLTKRPEYCALLRLLDQVYVSFLGPIYHQHSYSGCGLQISSSHRRQCHGIMKGRQSNQEYVATDVKRGLLLGSASAVPPVVVRRHRCRREGLLRQRLSWGRGRDIRVDTTPSARRVSAGERNFTHHTLSRNCQLALQTLACRHQ